jgi:hydroxymethylpyrimidine/phosphomethylpyrimidine kinase
MKYVLTIAGSDSCGGAGIQADIKTITALGAHAMTAITAVTAQNSLGVSAVHEIPREFISMQIEAVIKDIHPDAVKIGMLSSGLVIETVAAAIRRYRLKNIVLDTVMKASSGHELMDSASLTLFKEVLLPLAVVTTPNLYEAGILAGGRVTKLDEMEWAAKEIKIFGPDVVITGGHLEGKCIDLLYDGKDTHLFQGERIATANTHGTGCVFSSSLACFLAMGNNIVEAVRLSQAFTRRAIENNYPCGRGPGSVSPSILNEPPCGKQTYAPEGPALDLINKYKDVETK